MYANQWKDSSRHRLASDVSNLLRDLDDYLAASAGQTGDVVASGRERLLAAIEAMKLGLAELERDAAGRTRAAGRLANDFVHENAWQSIAAAACLGLVAGWLSGRR
jgi:ElaB/YqjD/DUF883 family membrane-anchored ribosome-binding protein